jgi:hypothetical protein
MINRYTCPVCGFAMEEPPRDYHICPCCGTEFGYHDVNSSIEAIRAEWLRNGLKWWSEFDVPPVGWDPFGQVSALLASNSTWVGNGLRNMIAADDQRCRQEDLPTRAGLGLERGVSGLAA